MILHLMLSFLKLFSARRIPLNQFECLNLEENCMFAFQLSLILFLKNINFLIIYIFEPFIFITFGFKSSIITFSGVILVAEFGLSTSLFLLLFIWNSRIDEYPLSSNWETFDFFGVDVKWGLEDEKSEACLKYYHKYAVTI